MSQARGGLPPEEAWLGHIKGPVVSLEDMLRAREERVARQSRFLSQYNQTLLSFSLNIVGEIKVFPLSVRSFYQGIDFILQGCASWGFPILAREETREITGYEAIFVLNTSSLSLKTLCNHLEDKLPLARLFDLDVITPSGEKLSRQDMGLPPRGCLLCQEEAFVCARSRRHSVREVLRQEVALMEDHFLQDYGTKISHLVGDALIEEVQTTPKPGLVDRNNTGAHRDMDLALFHRSIFALLPFFREFVLLGGRNPAASPEILFPQARELGKEAEFAMRQATQGVNTHRGAIFSFGLFCVVLGQGYVRRGLRPYSPNFYQNLQEDCRNFCQGLEGDFAKITLESAMSQGEKVFAQWQIPGIRQEALAGYPSLFQLALPCYQEALSRGLSQNQAGVLCLLHLVAQAQDSNLIARSDLPTFSQIQQELQDYLRGNPQDFLDYALSLDERWIPLGLSPGGSADLLALTYFLHKLEGQFREEAL